MITRQQLTTASRFGVSVTIPELESDIDAQIRALADPNHPKHCVFLARGNVLGNRKLPDGLFVETRREGTLVTDNRHIAQAFKLAEFITDGFIAEMLGYPESKADVLLTDDGLVVQALDKDGNVIFEAACSQAKIAETIAAANAQVTEGGKVDVKSPYHALSRRLPRMN